MHILEHKKNCPKRWPNKKKKTKCWIGKERHIGKECPLSWRDEEQRLIEGDLLRGSECIFYSSPRNS